MLRVVALDHKIGDLLDFALGRHKAVKTLKVVTYQDLLSDLDFADLQLCSEQCPERISKLGELRQPASISKYCQRSPSTNHVGFVPFQGASEICGPANLSKDHMRITAARRGQYKVPYPSALKPTIEYTKLQSVSLTSRGGWPTVNLDWWAPSHKPAHKRDASDLSERCSSTKCVLFFCFFLSFFR